MNTQNESRSNWDELKYGWFYFDNLGNAVPGRFKSIKKIESQETLSWLVLYAKGVVDGNDMPEDIVLRFGGKPVVDEIAQNKARRLPPRESVNWEGFEEWAKTHHKDVEWLCEFHNACVKVMRK